MMPTTGTPAGATTANVSVALTEVMKMNEDELKNLYRRVRDQLKIAHLIAADNLNVVSVRLGLNTCDKVKHLAFARQTTLSDVVRDAIDAYCKRETQ
jgi:hypothetical protein